MISICHLRRVVDESKSVKYDIPMSKDLFMWRQMYHKRPYSLKDFL
jgi:hypothetical protein